MDDKSRKMVEEVTKMKKSTEEEEMNGKLSSTSPKDQPNPINLKTVIIGFFISLIFAALGTHFMTKGPINPEEFTLKDIPKFEGNLAQNDLLTKAQRILVDQVYGPESLAIHPKTNRVYASMRTGLICEIEIKNDEAKIVSALRLTNAVDCDGSYSSFPKCGRPLGLRFAEDGTLVVVDAYLGLFSINFKKEKVFTLFTATTEVVNDPTRPTRYLNDLDILPDGKIVISESSTKFDDRDFMLDMLEHRPNGRLLIYDPKTGEVRTLLSGLYFPNGVQVVSGKILYSEMGMARIMMVSLSSDNTVPLIDTLPGYPDNIRLGKDGHLLIAIPQLRSESDNYYAQRPTLRGFLAKVLSPQAIAALIDTLNTPYGLVIKANARNGAIITSYHDPSAKTISDISIAIEDHQGNILLGSDINYFIGKLNL